MTKPVLIEPEAEADIAAAYDWYEVQRPGLGEDFLLCLEASLDAISQRPRSFTKIRRTARRVLVRRFPYLILFTERRDLILVLGIFHTRRDPQQWDLRLP